jgi:hypothetical protein
VAVAYVLLYDETSRQLIIVDHSGNPTDALTAVDQPGADAIAVDQCTSNVNTDMFIRYDDDGSVSASNVNDQVLLPVNSGSDSEATVTYEPTYESRASLKRKRIAMRKRETAKRHLFGEAYVGFKRSCDGAVQHEHAKPERHLKGKCEQDLPKAKKARSFMCGAVT